MKKIVFHISLLLAVSIFTSCEIINPPEQVPSYIYIDSFILHGRYDSVGSLSNYITDAWVIVDNEFIGTYELPALIPVLKNGNAKLIIKAGIKENGIAYTRLPYPFYNYIIQNRNFIPKQIDTLTPSVYYLEHGYKMPIYEDFEDANFLFTKTERSNIGLESTDINEQVFEGEYSQIARLTKAGDLFEIESTSFYQLPRGKAIFLELNFKTNILLSVGYIAESTTSTYQHTVLNLNPTDNWKKIYINFGNEIDFESTQYVFKIFVGALKSTSGDTAVVQMDNIKLLYLE